MKKLRWLEEVKDITSQIEELEKKIKQLKGKRGGIYQKHGQDIRGFHNLLFDFNRMDEFKNDLLTMKSFAQIARKYNVIPKTVRNWVYRLKLLKYVEKNEKICRLNKDWCHHYGVGVDFNYIK